MPRSITNARFEAHSPAGGIAARSLDLAVSHARAASLSEAVVLPQNCHRTSMGAHIARLVLPMLAHSGSLRLDRLAIGWMSVTLDALIRWREIVDGLLATHGGSIALGMKRPVNMWIAAAVILLIAIGGASAQPKSGEPAAQPKRIVVLYSYGQNFQVVDHMEQGDPQSTEPTVALAAGHSRIFPRHGSEW